MSDDIRTRLTALINAAIESAVEADKARECLSPQDWPAADKRAEEARRALDVALGIASGDPPSASPGT